jgi:hypothetical protein
MIGDVLKLAVVWVFAIIGVVIVIIGFVKSEPDKMDIKNLILTLFLIIISISFTIDFLRKLK